MKIMLMVLALIAGPSVIMGSKDTSEFIQDNFPIQIYFYSLDKELILYKSPKLKEPIKKYKAVHHSVYVTNDAAGHSEEMSVLGFGTNSIKVNYRGLVGWVKRSSIRFKSLIVFDSDGNYIRDIFSKSDAEVYKRLGPHNENPATALSDLVNNNVLEKISDQIGFGKTGYTKMKDGLEERTLFNSVLDGSLKAVKVKNYIAVYGKR